MMVWSLVEANSASSCMANVAVPLAKVAAVMLSDAESPLV
jgi:hypothetical protein